jgi:osomolarity two-component system sensor histidine kinase NIK1
MGGESDAWKAAATILSGLGREVPASDDSVPSHNATNGVDTKKVKLPGETSPGKAAFECELQGLIRRVHDLETEVVSPPLLFFCFLFRASLSENLMVFPLAAE